MPKSSGQIELLFPESSPTKTWLEVERDTFESVYIDTIVVRPTENFYFELETLQESLLALDGVEDVVVPHENNNYDIFGLHARDGQHARLILKVSSRLAQADRDELHDSIEGLLNEYEALAPLRAGTFVTMQEVAEVVAHESKRLLPWIVVFLFLMLVIFFRSLKVATVVLGSNLLAVATSILLYSVLGFDLGPVSQLAPPFLLAIGTSFHLHVAVRLLTHKQGLETTLRELRIGVFLAVLTTSLSVGTLIMLNVTDVSRFAVFASVGAWIAGVYATTLLTVLVRWFTTDKVFTVPVPIRLITRLCNRHTLFVALAFSIVLGLGALKLRVHTDPLSFLPHNHPTLKAINNAHMLFPGNHFLTILLKGESSTQFKNDYSFLEPFVDEAKQLSGVERVVSPYDFQLFIEQSGAGAFLQDFSMHQGVGSSLMSNAEKGIFRIVVETEREGQELLELRARLSELIENHDELGRFEVALTSLELVMAEQTNTIVYSLLRSLLLAIAMVWVLLLVVLRNVYVACVSIVPNVVPLLTVFGVLGYSGQSLDFGSCLVATAALGIAVDNTFHFLLCWRERSREHGSPMIAIKAAIETVAGSFCITSGSLIVAFAIMGTARSLPVANFGLLLSVTLSIGLFADLILLPYLLTLLQGRGGLQREAFYQNT